MQEVSRCGQCQCAYPYLDGAVMVCPECGHEWAPAPAPDPEDPSGADTAIMARDANGNRLADGDAVTVVKDLKVKGSSAVIKVGTRVRNIRLVDGDHAIDCKVDGIGALKLKAEFVRKA